jgi:hypothetical protein
MSKTTTRRAALSAIAAAASALPVAMPTVSAFASEPDQIFALIEAHKAAVRRDVEAIEVVTSTPFANVGAHEDAQDRRSETADNARDLQISLLTTPPTTMAGVVAVLRHAMTGQYGDIYFEDGHASTVLGDLYMSEDAEMIEIAQNFLPMTANTIARLSGGARQS